MSILQLLCLCLSIAVISTQGCFDRSKTLPIPQRSLGPIEAGKSFYVGRLSTEKEGENGVYWGTSGLYNFMFVVHSGGIVVIDAPPGFSSDAVKSISKKAITHFIYSHIHSDHIGDAGLFVSSSTQVIAQEETAEFIKDRAADNATIHYPFPTVTFCDKYELTVDTYKIQLSYLADAHAGGNTLIWLPNQKVLMQIDLVTARWAPFRRLNEMENIPLYMQNLDTLLSYDFTYMVIIFL
jgi:glyoxylase-like metal-dependent hydrolase (beta-lactamase superfamily II)